MSVISDYQTMTARCVKLSLRNPEMIIMSLVTPVMLLFLFYYLFGSAMDSAHFTTSYINYIVPGVLIIAIGQSAATTSVVVCSDIQKGNLDRFLSLPISRSSFLVGHVVSALARNITSTVLVIAIAFGIGFRPEAGLLQWVGIVGVLLIFMLMMTWVSVFLGLLVKTPESAGALLMFIQVFTYLSSGFVPTHTMPTILRVFCENQPLTPIIETIRSLFLSSSSGNNWIAAILWSVGVLVLSYVFSMRTYKRVVSK